MTEIPNVSLETQSDTVLAAPDQSVKVREAFGVDSDMEVPAFSEADGREFQHGVPVEEAL